MGDNMDHTIDRMDNMLQKQELWRRPDIAGRSTNPL